MTTMQITPEQRDQARKIREAFIDLGGMGTAEQILFWAKQFERATNRKGHRTRDRGMTPAPHTPPSDGRNDTMSTESQRDQARKIRDAFIALGGIPSSLRGPLAAVQDGTEEPGTAEQILFWAKQFERAATP